MAANTMKLIPMDDSGSMSVEMQCEWIIDGKPCGAEPARQVSIIKYSGNIERKILCKKHEKEYLNHTFKEWEDARVADAMKRRKKEQEENSFYTGKHDR